MYALVYGTQVPEESSSRLKTVINLNLLRTTKVLTTKVSLASAEQKTQHHTPQKGKQLHAPTGNKELLCHGITHPNKPKQSIIQQVTNAAAVPFLNNSKNKY